ncbi:helix-turn-helix domain-containing protein [Streptococcus suis]|uniref:LexA family transcriptional regulator n=3 Tax=Streptococcus suis TaxID=1307 RepID=UPI000CF62861|nr:XRE family transcriptional regulator [Streptococcus suis]MBS8071138.1 helix-turn-helix domain-containing protein [Streptococcus suis]
MPIENKDIFSKNLKYYMDKKGVDRNQLCADLDLKYTTVRDWIKGITYPRIGKIELLANYFGINKSDLIEEKSTITTSIAPPNSPVATISDKVVYLDQELKEPRHSRWISHGEQLLKEQAAESTVEESQAIYFTYNYYDQPASAGTGQYLNDVQVEQIELPVNVQADFVVPIYGDSMEPEYQSGDYIFVKLSVDLSDGDIGVFEYYGDAYIKQLLINEDGAFLHSLNEKYNDIKIDKDSDFRIIGQVVDVYRET